MNPSNPATNGTEKVVTGTELADLRAELEQEHARLDDSDLRYHAIEDALRRIDEGGYGVCTECHEPIPYGRLLVMPETLYCVTCGPRA